MITESSKLSVDFEFRFGQAFRTNDDQRGCNGTALLMNSGHTSRGAHGLFLALCLLFATFDVY